MHESAGKLLLSKRNFPLLGMLLNKEMVSACGNGQVLAHSCGVNLRYIAAQNGEDKQKQHHTECTYVTRHDSDEGNVN